MTKRSSKRARKPPPPRRPFPWLSCLAAVSLALLFAYQWMGANAAGLADDSDGDDMQGIVSIAYLVDPREWPERHPICASS